MSILSLEHADVSFLDENLENEVLKDISISFEPKKIYVITGPNGGGKSTLAKYMMGIVKGKSGKIILDGEDITEENIVNRSKKGIGYAFQTPAKFKGLKVKEMLRLSRGDGKKSVRKTLKSVGLCPEDYLERTLDSTFSGGEMKRIEIATIFIRDLKVAIFDEPEAGIDLWSFQRLTETFEELQRNSDTCIIIISHQERIMALADEIIVIEKGEIKERTTKNKFLETFVNTRKCDGKAKCCKGGEDA
jgi:Fe-S cluster assembly ATP-binding protein